MNTKRKDGSRHSLKARDGMTVLEVLLSMAIFMIGSVSLIGLFVAASVLHVDAVNRRTAAIIAEELLAQVQSTRFREVFARTQLAADLSASAPTVQAISVTPDADNPEAQFSWYPELVPPEEDPDGSPGNPDGLLNRTTGPLLIEQEWLWYNDLNGNSFENCDRGLWGTPDSDHLAGATVLQPRTWHYVLDQNMDAGTQTALVRGDPTSLPPGHETPRNGYLVIDEEWITYEGRGAGSFNNLTRGIAGTKAVPHSVGTPVTVAREHPRYPNFFYTVQFYPSSSTGREARVVISVAYKTGNRTRAWFFPGLFSPKTF